MTPEHHLWACALEVERQYGEGAFLHPAMRIDELTAEGNLVGAKVWAMIMQRLEDLEVGVGGPRQ